MSKAITALTLLLTACAGYCWVHFFDDSSEVGTAVLGAYRGRWFLCILGLSYLAFWGWVLVIFHPGRNAVFRIIAAHFGLCFILVLLEASAFFGLVNFRDLLDQDRAGTLSASNTDPRLSRVSKPLAEFSGEVPPDLVTYLGIDAEPISFHCKLDRYGLRNVGDKRDPHIFCLGDSILVAGYTPVQATVTELLQEILQEQVLNVSEVGYSPQEELIRLHGLGLDLKGRNIMQFIFEGNDLTDSAKWRIEQGQSKANRWPQTGLFKQLLMRMHSGRKAAGMRRGGVFKAKDGSKVSTYFLYDGPSVQESIGELTHLQEHLAKAKREIEAQGGEYRLVFVPTKLSVLHGLIAWNPGSTLSPPDRAKNEFSTKMKAFAREHDIPFLDLTPAMRAAAEQGELPYYPADTHLNAVGHRVMAETLAAWLQNGKDR